MVFFPLDVTFIKSEVKQEKTTQGRTEVEVKGYYYNYYYVLLLLLLLLLLTYIPRYGLQFTVYSLQFSHGLFRD